MSYTVFMPCSTDGTYCVVEIKTRSIKRRFIGWCQRRIRRKIRNIVCAITKKPRRKYRIDDNPYWRPAPWQVDPKRYRQ